MYTVPLLLTAANTVGLKGDHATLIRYSVYPGSKMAIGLTSITSYIRIAPSDEHVRKILFWKGEQAIYWTGPR